MDFADSLLAFCLLSVVDTGAARKVSLGQILSAF
jgi:hypothetical protein